MKKLLSLLVAITSSGIVLAMTLSSGIKISQTALSAVKVVNCKCINGKTILTFISTTEKDACNLCENACRTRGGVDTCKLSKK